VGGYIDEEFKEATIMLFDRLVRKEVIFVVSDLLDLELINAPKHVSNYLLQFSSNKFERVELTEDAKNLLKPTYLQKR
jgi:hypothetical protein